MPAPKAPPGYRFDPFADARMGRSLFQMAPEDWLVPDPEQCTCQGGYDQPEGCKLRANDCPIHGLEDGDED